MKLSLATPDLLAQLQTVTRVAAQRSAVQALSGVKVDADGDSVRLLATDMDVGVSVPLSADVASPGSAVLPARLLLDVVRALPAPELSLEMRAAQSDVELVCGPATFHLRLLRAEDFPTLPSPAAENRVALPADAFVQTVTRVQRSASHDETRPVLTGILMSASAQRLRMAATDSHRLSVKETALDRELDGSLEANIPARALSELVRIAQQGAADTLAVSVGQNQAVFEVGDVVLSTRLIDGQFPNYRHLFPESVEHEMRIATAELTDVARRISLLALKNQPLRLTFTDGALALSAQTPDVGEASESIPVPFQGDTFEIGFNPEFLRDGLESVESDELVLKLISPLRPGLIESPEPGEFVYLLMPIRLNV